MGSLCIKSADVHELKDMKQLPTLRKNHRSVYDQFDHHVDYSDTSDGEEKTPYVSHVTNFADDSSSSSSDYGYFEE